MNMASIVVGRLFSCCACCAKFPGISKRSFRLPASRRDTKRDTGRHFGFDMFLLCSKVAMQERSCGYTSATTYRGTFSVYSQRSAVPWAHASRRRRMGASTRRKLGRFKVPRPQRIRDPVHNLIEFNTRDFEQMCWRLIQTPAFQRLRRVKQLAFSELVYPGATHSRFSHSLDDERQRPLSTVLTAKN
jgi:hypothetical protein